MRIGEIARRAGLRPSAIRFYEKAGILPPALRKSGQRSFSAETELYLVLIGFARQAGFSIAEIRTLFHGFREGTTASARWKALAQKKHRELDLMVVRLKSMQALLKKAMRCKCIGLADCGRIVLGDARRM
jgi:MerR family transcriptional regulator, redox-sensitive transcriptional activator SoxR